MYFHHILQRSLLIYVHRYILQYDASVVHCVPKSVEMACTSHTVLERVRCHRLDEFSPLESTVNVIRRGDVRGRS